MSRQGSAAVTTPQMPSRPSGLHCWYARYTKGQEQRKRHRGEERVLREMNRPKLRNFLPLRPDHCDLMTGDSMHKHSVQLDRAKSNPLFDSWKLATGLAVSKQVLTLEGQVAVRDHDTDYLNTRAAILHNHLHQQCQQIVMFTRDAGVSSLQEVVFGEHIKLRTICEQVDGHDDRVINRVEAPGQSTLQPSVAAIEGFQSPDAWLVSSGQGDMLLISSSEAHGPCFPLQASEPAGTQRSLHIEAAFQSCAGQIQAVAWNIRQKSVSKPAGCDIYLITASFRSNATDAKLKAEAVQLLQVTALPPHAVVVQPELQSILIASSGPEATAGSAAGPGPSAPSSVGGDDDDVDSVSPRTLKQAADRLAQFTSDQPAVEAVPRNEFSDVYNEVGPDNVGGMGAEPSCTITLFTLNKQGQVVSSTSGHKAGTSTSGAADVDVPGPEPVQDADEGIIKKHLPDSAAPQDSTHAAAQDISLTAGEGTGQTAAQEPRHTATAEDEIVTAAEDTSHEGNDQHGLYVGVDQMECDPHKVVAVRPGQHNQMLLGLSNDVDCAAVAFSCSSKLLLESQHLHSIPALAYVAAGKIHKKFTLLGHSKSLISAVIVEGNRFSYVYKHTSGRQSTGDSQIIDMGLAERSPFVLGAALHWHDGQDRLLVLVPSQLLVFNIRVA